MKSAKIFSASLIFFAAVVLLPTASAAIIPTLFNTGVDNAGSPLANGTIGDPHYDLITKPTTSTDFIRVITSAGGFPIGPWIGDNTLSAWIGPNNNDDLVSPAGTYIYRTTFDLTGYDISTAIINGQWSTDNNGLDIFINGNSLGFTTANNQFSLGFAPFTINSGFVPGINTLDFMVNNGGTASNPTGLRTQMIGEADFLPIPTPGVAWLIGIGMIAILTARKR